MRGPHMPALVAGSPGGPPISMMHLVPSWTGSHYRPVAPSTTAHAASPSVGLVAVPDEPMTAPRVPQQQQASVHGLRPNTVRRISRVGQQRQQLQHQVQQVQLAQPLADMEASVKQQQMHLWQQQQQVPLGSAGRPAAYQADAGNSSSSSGYGYESYGQPLPAAQQSVRPSNFQQTGDQHHRDQQQQQQNRQEKQQPWRQDQQQQQQRRWQSPSKQYQQPHREPQGWQQERQQQDWQAPQQQQRQQQRKQQWGARLVQQPAATPHQHPSSSSSSSSTQQQQRQQQQQQQVKPADNLRYHMGSNQSWALPTGMAVTYLGSSSGAPTRDRNVSCTLLRLPDSIYMVDCGEGSSRQMKMTGMKVEQLDTIFITHLHGDHCFGIGTMLAGICKARKGRKASSSSSSSSSSISEVGPDSPDALRVVGPPRLGELVSAMLFDTGLCRYLDLPLYITEFVEQNSEAHDWQPLPGASPSLQSNSSSASSSPPCVAFIRRMAPTVELGWQDWPPGLIGRLDSTGFDWRREGNMRRNTGSNFVAKPGLLWKIPCRQAVVTAAQLQHRVPCWGFVFDELLQAPATSASNTSSSSTSDSDSENSKLGRRVVLLGDTIDSRAIAPAAVGADLVSHEATFAAGMESKAAMAQHSTAWMAGQFAWAVEAKSLVLTHFSSRYEGSVGGSGMLIKNNQDARDGGRDRGRDGRRVRAWEVAQAATYAQDSEERAILALQREAEDQYGLGQVLLARDLLTAHVPKQQQAGDS